MIPDPVGVSELSKIEQVRYLQALWDRIAEQPDNLPIPESHLALAEERLAEYRRNPAAAHSAFDMLDEFTTRPELERRCP